MPLRVATAGSSAHLAVELLRPHAERVADRVRELGAVERVEVELIDAMTLQHVHLLDRDCGRNQLARLRIFLETVEAVLEPFRDRRAATLRETRDLWKT